MQQSSREPARPEAIDERRVTWMPAFPGAVFTLILLAVFFSLGLLVAIVGLGLFVVRLVQRRWDAWAWVGLGSIIGTAVFWLLMLLHAVF